MSNYLIPIAIRDVLLCLVFLAGIASGISAIIRSQRKTGIFVICGFSLLGINSILNLVIYNFIFPNISGTIDLDTFNLSYIFVSGIVDVVGFLALIAAIYLAIQKSPKELEPAQEDVIYVSNR
jgi:hypothetical protein